MQAGDRTWITERPGYKLVQNRPFDCRTVCQCGTCNGVLTEYHGTVTEIVAYADNSIEATVQCDDGKTRIQRLSYPHGDVC